MKAIKLQRTYLPKDWKVSTWENLKPFFEGLLSRPLNGMADLQQWLKDRSELESVLEEEMGWRYVRMTCDTQNKELSDHFNYFVAEIQPKIAPYSNDLNLKLVKHPLKNELKKDAGLANIIRSIESDIELFREKNIPLMSELEQEAHEFGSINAAMTVEVDGKELTLQQASDFLQSSDRAKREEVYLKIANRRIQDKDALNELYSKLVVKRDEVAKNADFPNYRDYMFKAMGRFDYSVKDVFNFHDAIKKHVVPLLNKLGEERKAALGLTSLRPWDGAVNYFGSVPLKPFSDGEELLSKTVTCFNRINPALGGCLETMKSMKHLDLISRIGKAPGGYNYPLDETGVPFIFMNASTSLRDLVTLVHEGGHAYHSFLVSGLPLQFYKHPSSEVAELASMSMELFSMEHWDIFFSDARDLNRAKREHLEGILATLPWVAIIDKFQHWIYEHPTHTVEQREQAWLEISGEFSSNLTDWSGLETFKKYTWQKQLHLYEVPFYYIEYGMAQLGAVALWKNFKADAGKTFQQYTDALSLGYSRTIPEIYAKAGVSFDFSESYIKGLMDFVWKELEESTPD
ncbi:MAG: pepF [Chitinophagaceae bacterium]|nr:pepF [Chitinophagaceae bacterium]